MTLEMYKRDPEREALGLQFVPTQYKTQQKCERVAERWVSLLKDVFDWYKTQMCERAVLEDTEVLEFVP